LEKSSYKVNFQKLKGGWVVYLLLISVVLSFINTIAGIVVGTFGVMLFLKFKKDPENNSALYYNYAIKTLQGGDVTRAKASLTQAISLNKYNKEAFFFLGCLYFDEQDYTNALEYLKLGGIDEIRDPSLTFVLGRCYYHIENFKTSVKYLEMIEYQEGSEMEKQRLFTLGRAYSELEEYEKSFKVLEKVKMNLEELKGDSLEYCYFFGVACYHLDKDKEARDYIQKVFDVDRVYKYVDLYAKNIGLTTI
jgi:tetratricopeptide (TPR) repeat protein